MRNKEVCLLIEKFFTSVFMPIISAFVVLICYYLGWDMVSVWYLSLCGVGIMLTCKDVTPIFVIFLLMGVFVSRQHSPAVHFGTPDYYTHPAVLTQIIFAIVMLVGTMTARIAESVVYRRFKITRIFIGLAIFAAVMLFNGLFSEYYTVMDLVYGLFLAVLFFGIFCFANGIIQISDKTFKQIAFAFLSLFTVLAMELIIAYCTYDSIIVDGVIQRGQICFGWGTYNNLGMYLVICIPASFYLAAQYKHGWAFTVCGIFNLVITYLSMSRQAILMGSIIFAACAIWLIVRTDKIARIINSSILGGCLLVGIIIAVCMNESLLYTFSHLMDSLETGSTRTDIWVEGINRFLNYPLFGAGFYSIVPWVWGQSQFANILPVMCHNTVVQLLSCGGLLGFGAYVFHRAQTIISFFKNITHDRIFVALTIAALLLVSLLDNHIFYMFPTLIYSMLVGVLALSEKAPAKKEISEEKKEEGQVAAI